jgi:hypothetical protein
MVSLACGDVIGYDLLQEERSTMSAPAPQLGPADAASGWRPQLDDLRWAATAPEVQQHAGKAVVVRNRRVIVVGVDPEAALVEARHLENCAPWELVVEVVPTADGSEIPPDAI